MNSPEQPDRPAHLPDFIQSFNGYQLPVNQEELEAVHELFGALVDDLFLRHIDSVSTKETHIGRRHWKRNTLELEVDDEHGTWRVGVVSSDVVDRTNTNRDTLPEKGISLLFIDNDGHEREQFLYETGEDLVVRRKDLGDAWEQEQFDELLKGLKDYDHAQEDLADDDWNEELEEAMGLYNQPISMNEADGLKRFLLRPEARARRW